MSAFRRLFVLALASATLVPAWGSQGHPQGWKVETHSSVVAAKAGVYSFTVAVKDATGQPVNDAQVSLRVPTFARKGSRLVEAHPSGGGRYWAVVQLHRDYQLPRDVTAEVTPPITGQGR